MAALIAVAAAISVLVGKAVGGAAASATPACATATPWQHHADPQPQRARARAHAHRVMTAHAVEIAARARRNREGSPTTDGRGGKRHRWAPGRPRTPAQAPSPGRGSRSRVIQATPTIVTAVPRLAWRRGGPVDGSARRQTADFEQFEPERLDLGPHTVERGLVGQRASQHGLVTVRAGPEAWEPGAHHLAQAAADTD